MTIPPHLLDQKIIALCKEGLKLQAIKLYKDNTNSSLVDSKNYVDELAAMHGL